MILTFIEYDQTALTEASRQMLTFARKLAGEAGDSLAGVVIGAGDGAALVGELKSYGVATVILATGDGLQTYAPVAWARTLSQLIDRHSPKMVMAPSTDSGNEVMAHLAALSDLPMAASCSAVSLGSPLRITRLRWGSSLLEEALLEGEPALLTVAMHVVEPAEVDGAGDPAVEEFSPGLEDQDTRVKLVRHEEDVAEGVTLKNASIVVGGGRGVGSSEAYSVLEELAVELGAAVGCTRVATNNGWRPHSDQVGLTGTRISPDLYIACGISGAIQHLVGCKGAKKVMVINKDPEAAFFAKADYGVLGDLHEVLPAITEELKKVNV